MRSTKWLFPALSFIVLLLIFLRPEAGWSVRSFFMGSPQSEGKDTETLRIENASLKAQIAKLQVVRDQLPQWSADYVRAVVSSRYPFNFKNELLINAGKNQSIFVDEAVIFGKILIGQIQEVFGNTSIVKTIFDNRWQSAVQVGQKGVQALLKGGGDPKLTLIDKKAKVMAGDVVYNVAPGLPYGAPIAEVGRIELSPDNLFQEASLKLQYDLGDIRSVLVIKNAK